MKALRILSSLALTLSGAALAQPAVLEDGVLSIPDGVVLNEDGSLYYRNIQLQAEAGNRFRVLAAEPRNLAEVESVEVLILESFPVQVRVQVEGYLRMACLDLEEPVVRRVEDAFEIWLAETPIDPLALCAQVIEPFSLSIPLATGDLPAGEYQLRVNAVEASFTLP